MKRWGGEEGGDRHGANPQFVQRRKLQPYDQDSPKKQNPLSLSHVLVCQVSGLLFP
jgi:hypothetical protein